MHYRNGREAKNGDLIVSLCGAIPEKIGILRDAIAGNDYCNGTINPSTVPSVACLCDCLHVDDLAAILAEKGLCKRPDGK